MDLDSIIICVIQCKPWRTGRPGPLLSVAQVNQASQVWRYRPLDPPIVDNPGSTWEIQDWVQSA